jgi:hypothetical protein
VCALLATGLLVHQNWRDIASFNDHDDLRRRAALETNAAKFSAHQNGNYNFPYTSNELLEIDVRYYVYASWRVVEPLLLYVFLLGLLSYLVLCYVFPTLWRFVVSGKL